MIKEGSPFENRPNADELTKKRDEYVEQAVNEVFRQFKELQKKEFYVTGSQSFFESKVMEELEKKHGIRNDSTEKDVK